MRVILAELPLPVSLLPFKCNIFCLSTNNVNGGQLSGQIYFFNDSKFDKLKFTYFDHTVVINSGIKNVLKDKLIILITNFLDEIIHLNHSLKQ